MPDAPAAKNVARSSRILRFALCAGVLLCVWACHSQAYGQEQRQGADQTAVEPDDNHEAEELEKTVDALMNKARRSDDKEEKLRLYDEVFALVKDNTARWPQTWAVSALFRKAELVDGREEKIRLYDTILFGMEKGGDFNFPFFAFKARLDLTTGTEEKLRLLDRSLSAYDAVMNAATRTSLLLQKATFADNTGDKSVLYDEVIEFCARHFAEGDKKTNALGFRDFFLSNGVLDHMGEAVIRRAALSESTGEKIKLYDAYLAFSPAFSPQTGGGHAILAVILTQKAALSGNPSIKSGYYDRKIQDNDSNGDRIFWYTGKSRAAKITERMTLEEADAAFSEEDDRDVEEYLAGAILERIDRTHRDSDERRKLCDYLIDQYSDSTNAILLYSALQACIAKAGGRNILDILESTRSEKERFELYDTAIERYKNIDDILVQTAVNDAVVAKARLEADTKAKAKATW